MIFFRMLIPLLGQVSHGKQEMRWKLIALVLCLFLPFCWTSSKCPLSVEGCDCLPPPKDGWSRACNKADLVLYQLNYQEHSKTLQLTCSSLISYKKATSESENLLQNNCEIPSNLTLPEVLNNNPQGKILSYGCTKPGSPLPSHTFLGVKPLEELDFDRCSLTNPLPTLFEYLKKVITLNMENSDIRSLPEDIFKPLVNDLEWLSLMNNGLEEIPKRIFKGMFKLKKLYLTNNLLKQLPDNIFKDLRSLELLDVQDNSIQRLQGNLLLGVVALKKVIFAQNDLREIDHQIFHQNLTHLTYIDFQSNSNLTQVPPGLLSNLTNLKNIFMINCHVSTWPDTFFSDCPSLKLIDISDNYIYSLPSKLFQHNEKLLTLGLKYNYLKELPENIFHGLYSLVNLDLGNNEFRKVPSRVFEQLFNLKTLKLDDNKIVTIENNDFEYLFQLENLTLKNNQITELKGPNPFGRGPLKRIDLSNNTISDFSSVNWNLYLVLKSLNLRSNHFKRIDIPRLFSNGVIVDLRRNQIEEINMETLLMHDRVQGDMDKVEVCRANFYFEYNPLSCDCHLLSFKRYAESVHPFAGFPDMDSLKCSTPKVLASMKISQVIDDQFVCPVNESCPNPCSCYLRATDSATTAECSNRNITQLPEELPYNTSVVYLQNNNLTTLAGMNRSCWNRVAQLFAEDNRIESLDCFLPPSLIVLSLLRNNLTRITQSMIDFVNSKRKLNLTMSSNPWICDCGTRDLKTMLLTKRKDVFMDEVTCGNPQSLMGQSIEELADSDLCPVEESQTKTKIIVAVVICMVLLTCGLIISVLYYRNKQTVIAYIYIHWYKLFASLFQDDLDEDKHYHAFVSYSSTDSDIARELIEELENKEPKFRLCIHERDWLPGNLITFNIVNSVQNSRRTILVLSESFIKSIWFQLEFHITYYQMLEDKIDRLIVIVKGDITSKNTLDKDLQFLLSTKTYLVWGEKYFWEKLRYALPHRRMEKALKESVPSKQKPNSELIRKIEKRIVNLSAQSAQLNDNLNKQQNSQKRDNKIENMIMALEDPIEGKVEADPVAALRSKIIRNQSLKQIIAETNIQNALQLDVRNKNPEKEISEA